MEERASKAVDNQQVPAQGPTSSEGELSRSSQTWILAGAILLAGLAASFVPGIIERKEAYDHIYPGCWQLIGRDDKCEMRTNVNAFIRGA